MTALSRNADDPRVAALAALRAVLERQEPLEEAVAAASYALAGRDRSFCRLLVTATLRHGRSLDAVLAPYLARGVPPEPARTILRLGAAQLLILATPAHAALDRSVWLAETHGAAYAKGLVNAVLRKLALDGPAQLAALDRARLVVPDWLWRSWSTQYGVATAHAIGAALLNEPPLDLTLKPGLDRVEWAGRLDADILPTGSLRCRDAGVIADLPGYADGAWWVQDAAAALPVRLLGAVAGRRVLDLCAAPGGKTAQLAAAGADVTAVDRAAARLGLLARNLARLNLEAHRVEADATTWRAPEPFPLIVLDAPCSATGTARRHPDILHTKKPGDLASLVALQDRLLDSAAAALAPGGTLVYCVCSLEPGEGPQRIADFLARRSDCVLDPIAPDELPGIEAAVTPEGTLRTLPSLWAERGGMDGFFAARLRRATI